METSHRTRRNLFYGGIDQDTDLHLVRQENYVDALNIRNGWGAVDGAITNIRSNRLCPNNLPDGINTCIGTVEDKIGHSVIFFIHNSNGNHGIYRYFPRNTASDPCGEIRLVYESSTLNFQLDWRIHSAKIVDGKLLYWTDAVSDELSIEGNPPRKINLGKADVNGKRRTYKFAIGDIVEGQVFGVTVFDENDVLVVQNNTVATAPPDPNSTYPYVYWVIEELITQLDGVIDADFNNCYLVRELEISMNVANQRLLLTSSNTQLIPTNHYASLSSEMLTLIKPMPQSCIEPTFVQSGQNQSNNVYGYTWQFRYRYVFDDGEKSAWSDMSSVPTNFAFDVSGPGVLIENSERYDEIHLSFASDELLSTLNWKVLIESIEIAARRDELDVWRSLGQFSSSVVGTGDNVVVFRNDRVYNVIASDDNGLADQQVFKPYDFVPRLSGSLESVVDEEGVYRSLWYANLENYPAPDCENLAFVTLLPYEFVKRFNIHLFDEHGIEQTSFKKFKKGGVYNIGVVFKDFYGRSTPTLPIQTLRFPFQYNFFPVVLPRKAAPEWATHYAIVVSKNQKQILYSQQLASQFFYVDVDDSEANTEQVPFADATHLAIQLTISTADIEDQNIIFKSMLNETWTPENGDRIHIPYYPETADGNEFHPNIERPDGLDYAIAGYTADSDLQDATLTIYVEKGVNAVDLSVITDQLIVELYRTRQNQDDLYYQIDCPRPVSEWNQWLDTNEIDLFDIQPEVLPGGQGNTRYWTGLGIGFRLKGDTYQWSVIQSYKRAGLDFGSQYVVESSRMHGEVNRTGGDLGRAFGVDDDYGEEFRYSEIRLTESFAPNSLVNGLSSFRGTDYVRINREFGVGKKLALVNKVLLAIATFKTQPIYVGRGELLDLSGNTSVGRTDRLLNISNELQSELGTFNPESIVIEEGRVYGWDAYKGVVWRYTTGAGQFPISEIGVRNRFVDLGSRSRTLDRKMTKVIGGFERRYATYYLTFNDSIGYTAQTWAFCERSGTGDSNNKWSGRMQWIPDCHGRIALDYVTFKNGELWVHERDGYNSIYGTQIQSTVTFVCNDLPDVIKLFTNIQQEASTLWEAIEIETNNTASYPNGMASQLLANKWGLYEGQWWADFLRDMNDPSQEFQNIPFFQQRVVAAMLRGRPLRGEIIKITLKLVNPNEYSILRGINTRYFLSEST